MKYYNIAPGGPPRPEGFVMSDSERIKMEALKKQMDNETLYGVKTYRDSKPRIQFAQISTDPISLQKNALFTIIDKDIPSPKNPDGIVVRKTYITMENNNENLVKWLKDTKYMLLNEVDFYKYYTMANSMYEYGNVIEEVMPRYKMFFNKYATVSNENAIFKQSSIANIESTTRKNSAETVNAIIMDYIKDHAATLRDYKNIRSLVNKYQDFSPKVILYILTEVCPSKKHVEKGVYKCTDKQMIDASEILNYEQQFKDFVDVIGGSTDDLYMAIAFCCTYGAVDKIKLFNKFRRNHNNEKLFPPIESFEDAINKISYVYDNKTSKKEKIYIKDEYERRKK